MKGDLKNARVEGCLEAFVLWEGQGHDRRDETGGGSHGVKLEEEHDGNAW